MSAQSLNVSVGVYIPDSGLVPLQHESQEIVLQAVEDGDKQAKALVNHIYTDDSTSPQEVHDDLISELVDQCVAGYNASVLIHGLHDLENTSHGLLTGLLSNNHNNKTAKQKKGLLRLAATQMFADIETRTGREEDDNKGDQEYLVLVSMYVASGVKDVFDLLLPRAGQTDLMNRSKLMRFRPTGSRCDELCQLELHSASQLCELYDQAMKLLPFVTPIEITHPHVVIDLRLESVYRENPYVIHTSLFRIINAFSGKDSLMQYKSPDMTALSKCSFGVSKKAAKYDVPIEARGLTLLLFDFWGGNALSVCIAVVSAPENHRGKASNGLPSDSHYYLALAQTIGFLSTTVAIECKPHVNKSTIEASISELRSEISKIGKKVSEASSATSTSPAFAGLTSTLQTLVQELNRVKQHTMQAKRRTAIESHLKRQAALQEQGWDLLLSTIANERLASSSSSSSSHSSTDSKSLHPQEPEEHEDDEGAEEAPSIAALEDQCVSAFQSVMECLDQHNECTARYERMKGRYERKYKVEYHKRDRNKKPNDKQPGQHQLEQDIAHSKHEQIMLSKDLLHDPKEVQEILENKGTQGLVGISPYNAYIASVTQYINHSTHHDGIYALPEEKSQEQLLRAVNLRKRKLHLNDLVMSFKVQRDLEELEERYASQCREIDSYSKMPPTEEADTLKRVARAMVDGHYKEQRQFLLKQHARNLMLHFNILTNHSTVSQTQQLKSELLMMFREYRSHFDGMKKSNEEASMELAGKATTDVLQLFEEHRELSEQLEEQYAIIA